MDNLLPGMVVKIRNRLWRVDGVFENQITVTNIDGGEILQRRFYAPFEKIQISQMDIPDIDSIGSYRNNKLLVEANRLNLIHSTAPLLSLQRSRIIPTTYQLVPLLMAMDMDTVRLIIADDAGVGKTIEVGLILTELLARQRISNFLVVCPATLREQWKDTLSYFFHIDCQIISSTHRKDLEKKMPVGANPWSFYKYLITSLDYIKQPSVKNEILDYNWDMVIIDEAHLVAKPHQRAKSSINMDRHIFAKAVSKKAKNIILMSATPHNGYSDSYASLIEMIDKSALSGSWDNMKIDRSKAKKFICQRRRADIEKWFEDCDNSKNPFPERIQEEVIIDQKYNTNETQMLKSIGEFSEFLIDLYNTGKSSVLSYWTVMHIHKRSLSSPEALRRTLRNRIRVLEENIKTNISEGYDQESIEYDEYIAKNYVFDNDIGEKLSEESASTYAEQTLIGSLDKMVVERDEILKLLKIAEKIIPNKDSKLKKLTDNVLPDMFENSNRVIIFTKYKDTLDYLFMQLKDRYDGVKVITIYGEMNEQKRLEEYKLFSKQHKAILVATDCISEGMNLQHACSQIIHYELPWNPNRLEQRNGRIDRYGQPEEKVYIKTLVVNDSLDTKILSLLMRKAEQIKHDYGFSPPYFSDSDVVLKLLKSNNVNIKNPYTQMSIFDMIDSNDDSLLDFDPFNDKIMEKIREESFYGQNEMDLSFVESQLLKTEECIGTKDDLKKFYFSCLNKFGCEYNQISEDVYEIKIYDDDLKVPNAANIITFNPTIGLAKGDIEVLDLGHPLIWRAIEKVRHLMYQYKINSGRISGIFTKDCESLIAVIAVLVRYMVNTNPTTVMEEIIHIPVDIYEDRILSQKIANNLLSAKPTGEVPAIDIKDSVEELYKDSKHLKYIDEAVSQKLIIHKSEREKIKGTINKDCESISWTKGIEDIAVTSKDILTITLYYPA